MATTTPKQAAREEDLDPTKGFVYCGSQWAHKQHNWTKLDGEMHRCPGATTAIKPNKGEPRERS